MGQSLSIFTWFAQIGQRWYRVVTSFIVGCEIGIVLQGGFESVDSVLETIGGPTHLVLLDSFLGGFVNAKEPFDVGDCVIEGAV